MLFSERRTTMRSPGSSEVSDCMSKLTLASRALATSMVTSASCGSTIGRFDSACGAIGTSTTPDSVGCRIGPPADSA
ncbi:hypothetical protein D3C72_2156490 [compost metagenome]